MKNLLTGLLLLASTTVPAQQETIIRIHPEQGTTVIDKNIYGQFAEHLGTCIWWPLGRRGLPNPQYQRLSDGCSQCFEGLESAYSSLAGRLLCR